MSVMLALRSSSGGLLTRTMATVVVATEVPRPSLTRKVMTLLMVEGFLTVSWYCRVRRTVAKSPMGADGPTRGAIFSPYVVPVTVVVMLREVHWVLPSMASAAPSLRVKDRVIRGVHAHLPRHTIGKVPPTELDVGRVRGGARVAIGVVLEVEVGVGNKSYPAAGVQEGGVLVAGDCGGGYP